MHSDVQDQSVEFVTPRLLQYHFDTVPVTFIGKRKSLRMAPHAYLQGSNEEQWVCAQDATRECPL
jgi:hypothetical protein